ncbi:MAG: hypothetical protein HOH66_09845 [Rhodospirillaceae bacterium]|nr:hypothetical protein [Rhodospirillaceae bacterium]MBT6118155.1 hypothetical protein [Rhodospirillaceae bacterium]
MREAWTHTVLILGCSHHRSALLINPGLDDALLDHVTRRSAELADGFA